MMLAQFAALILTMNIMIVWGNPRTQMLISYHGKKFIVYPATQNGNRIKAYSATGNGNRLPVYSATGNRTHVTSYSATGKGNNLSDYSATGKGNTSSVSTEIGNSLSVNYATGNGSNIILRQNRNGNSLPAYPATGKRSSLSVNSSKGNDVPVNPSTENNFPAYPDLEHNQRPKVIVPGITRKKLDMDAQDEALNLLSLQLKQQAEVEYRNMLLDSVNIQTKEDANNAQAHLDTVTLDKAPAASTSSASRRLVRRPEQPPPIHKTLLPPALLAIPDLNPALLTEADLLLADPATHTHPFGSHPLLPVHPGHDLPHSHPPFTDPPFLADQEKQDLYSPTESVTSKTSVPLTLEHPAEQQPNTLQVEEQRVGPIVSSLPDDHRVGLTQSAGLISSVENSDTHCPCLSLQKRPQSDHPLPMTIPIPRKISTSFTYQKVGPLSEVHSLPATSSRTLSHAIVNPNSRHHHRLRLPDPNQVRSMTLSLKPRIPEVKFSVF